MSSCLQDNLTSFHYISLATQFADVPRETEGGVGKFTFFGWNTQGLLCFLKLQCIYTMVRAIIYTCMLSCFSCVWLFMTLWTVACQVPLFMGFSRQEYWSGLPCPPPGDLPDPRIEPASLNISCIGRQVIYICTYLHSEVSFFLCSLNERFFKFYSALQFSEVSHRISYLLKCFFGHTPRHVGSESLIRHQTCVVCIGSMES